MTELWSAHCVVGGAERAGGVEVVRVPTVCRGDSALGLGPRRMLPSAQTGQLETTVMGALTVPEVGSLSGCQHLVRVVGSVGGLSYASLLASGGGRRSCCSLALDAPLPSLPRPHTAFVPCPWVQIVLLSSGPVPNPV